MWGSSREKMVSRVLGTSNVVAARGALVESARQPQTLNSINLVRCAMQRVMRVVSQGMFVVKSMTMVMAFVWRRCFREVCASFFSIAWVG